jgi:hypothetical protein
MAITLIGTATAGAWGVASAELGFNCKSFSVTVAPEINHTLPYIDGQVRGAAIGDPMGDLSMEGEALDLTTASNAMLVGFVTAFVPNNSTNYFGRTAGGWYLQTGTIKLDRAGFKDISFSHKSHFGLA